MPPPSGRTTGLLGVSQLGAWATIFRSVFLRPFAAKTMTGTIALGVLAVGGVASSFNDEPVRPRRSRGSLDDGGGIGEGLNRRSIRCGQEPTARTRASLSLAGRGRKGRRGRRTPRRRARR